MYKKLVYGLTTLHLCLVTAVILRMLPLGIFNGKLEAPLACLTSVNYSAWRFAFFTPDIGKSTEIEAILSNRAGDTIRLSTNEDFRFFTHNLESENRFYGYKVHSAKDSMFIDLSARSASTFLLNEYPTMDRITYRMNGMIYPEMQEQRRDSAIIEDTFYEITFSLY